MMNYSDRFQVNVYVQQNPIHTLEAKAVSIEESEAMSALNSNFIKRMIVANFNKTAMDLLFAEKYLDNGEIKYYDKKGIEFSAKRIIENIQDKAKEKLPKALVFE